MTGNRHRKCTMTLNLSEEEMRVVEDLATKKDFSKTQLIRQALRLYQQIEVRQARGECLMLSRPGKMPPVELVVIS